MRRRNNRGAEIIGKRAIDRSLIDYAQIRECGVHASKKFEIDSIIIVGKKSWHIRRRIVNENTTFMCVLGVFGE